MDSMLATLVLVKLDLRALNEFFLGLLGFRLVIFGVLLEKCKTKHILTPRMPSVNIASMTAPTHFSNRM